MEASKNRRWDLAVGCGTAALTALRCLYASRVELAPQEAYYWQYARHLDLSYFDHPPLAAWLVALSTRWLGSTELAVRLPAVAGGAALVLLLHRLVRRLYGARVGAIACLLASSTVLFGLGSVIITPDVPLAVCWTAALGVMAELFLPDGKGAGRWGARWWLLGGLCGLALLSKYTAGLLVLQIFLTALLTPRGRQALRTPAPYLGLALALGVFSPVLIWNAQHGWASILFQSTGRTQTVHGLQPHLFGRYVGLQALALGPLLYLALWIHLPTLLKRAWQRDDLRARLLAISSLPGLLLFTAVSPLHWVKLNWVGPAYLGLLVSAAASWANGRSRFWTRWAVPAMAVTSAGLTAVLYLMPLIPELPFRDRDDLVNGWRELAAAVSTQMQRATGSGPPPYIIGWGYKAASELAFYLPGQPRTLSASSLGGSGLAYAYWTADAAGDARVAKDAIVVADDREPLSDADSRLGAFCASVSSLPDVWIHRGNRRITRFRLWHCKQWHRPSHELKGIPGS